MSSNSKPCMIRPTLIELNHVKFNYYPFMVSLDKHNGSCNNAVDDSSVKVCVLSKTKGVQEQMFSGCTSPSDSKALKLSFTNI